MFTQNLEFVKVTASSSVTQPPNTRKVPCSWVKSYVSPTDDTLAGNMDAPPMAVRRTLQDNFSPHNRSPNDAQNSHLSTGDKQEEEEDEEDVAPTADPPVVDERVAEPDD